ncbi:hypothetical protein GALL_266730 [mine drainage metagenome]|uniref:DUF3443 domain-containing protein n=1 Tax=mine drainage metagenome TaxID=410659 RepID=A0A1J5RHC3_9ZZZZ
MRSGSSLGARGWAVIVAAALALAACGSGGGGSGGSAAAGNTNSNLLPIVVDAGPANTVNVPFVSVTICAPGGSNCQTIDHVILDTGSTGLRIMSSVLNASLAQALSQQKSGSSPLAECVQFADGYVWGPVKTADVALGGEAPLKSLALQVIGDPNYNNVPSDCSNTGPAENSVQAFGGNGILGVAVFQQDCGAACAQAATPATYYACTGASCQAVAVPLAQQVQNPVGLLPSDNNGVVIDLPTVAATGAATAAGSLYLGIGTEADNALGSAKVYALDSSGNFTTVFNGQRYAGSFVDSGSNALYFPDGSTTVCSSGFYCPASPQQFVATNQGTNGASGSVAFSVANADGLLATGNTAFSNLAGPSSGIPSFDWGLPFHFGRRVYTAIEGRSTPGGTGPYVAY